MNKYQKYAFPFLFSALLLVVAAGADASQFTGKKIERVCLYGTFIGTYTNCDSGQQVSVSAPKIALARIPLNPDGLGFKVYDKNVIKTRSYDDNIGSIVNITFAGIGGNFRIAEYLVSMQDLVLGRNDVFRQEWAVKRFGSGDGGGWELISSAAAPSKPQSAFPVAELGNCKSESDCKQYCAKSENIPACAAYGEKRGLVSPEEAARAREFADVLRGEGPGGCKDQKACESYCDGTAHLDECVVFAEKHNLLPPDQLKEAKQVLKAISEGGKLPGGCTDKNSCESYCTDPAHGTECVDFAEKAGFMTAEEVAEARKVLPLIARGESPGGCKNKEQCEKYCESEANTMECVTFAEKAGFMTSEEAAMVRKTGGKGPGGCRSKEACESYCNEPQNQESCFEFAQKYDLIPPEKLQEIKDGMGRLRSGLKQMPESAVECLEEELGEESMAKIEDGSFMPSPKMGEIMKGCMARAMPEIKAKIESAMEHATPETRACLEKGLGAGGLDKILTGAEMTPEMGDVMRTCFESMRTEGMKQMREGLKQMPEEMKACVEDKLGKDFISKVENGEDVEVGPEMGEAFQSCAGNAEEMMDKALEQAPPEIRDCIKSKIGDVSKIRGPQDVMGYVQECMAGFMPKGIPGGMIPGASYRPPGVPGGDDDGEEGLESAMPKIPEGMEKYMPQGIPSGSGGGISIPEGIKLPDSACAAFKAAPSCDYVPESMRDACKQCLD